MLERYRTIWMTNQAKWRDRVAYGLLAVAFVVSCMVFVKGAMAHADPEPHCGPDENPPYDYVGVHYRGSPTDGKNHFTDMGFNVVGNVHVDQGSDYNCNSLRTGAYNAWRNCKAKFWTYSGSQDYGEGACSLYYFDGEYSGSCQGNPRGDNVPGFAKGC